MGKKIDLNSPRKSNDIHSIRKTNYNSNHLPTPPTNSNQIPSDDAELSNNQTKQGTSNLTKKGAEMALKTVGVPKGIAKSIAQDDRTYEMADKVKGIIKFPLAPKLIMISAIVLPILFVFLILFVILGNDESTQSSMGLNGYPYYPGVCKSVKADGKIMDIEEYVSKVIPYEVGEYSGETLKVFAIAARSFIINSGTQVGTDADSCYYEAPYTDARFQVYKPGEVGEVYKKAVEDTKGLIITIDGKIARSNYDASCMYTASQARAKTPDQTFSDDYVYIKYGSLTIGGDNYQAIPKSDNYVGSIGYYLRQSVNKPCAGNHGYGMSQNGSYYLDIVEGYTWKEILDYYYQSTESLMSIYPSYGYDGEYPINPSDELYQNLHFLVNYSITDLLSDNGSSIETFNANLKSAIDTAGYGTREGVVAAAMNLVGPLAFMGYKINYEWGGGHEEYRIGAKSTLGNYGSAYCGGHTNTSECRRIYKWQGFDCSGFVMWALYNGTGKQVSTYQLFHSNATKALSGGSAVCQPGDALYSSGHVVLVVGIDEETSNYIVVEAAGYAGYGVTPTTDTSNYGGVKLSYFGFAKSGYRCNDLSYVYS